MGLVRCALSQAMLIVTLLVLTTGCDAPLRHDTLIQRLGTGAFSEFSVTFYRYAPPTMQNFAAGIAERDYLSDSILSQGPIEMLEIRHDRKAQRTTITRTGNAFDAQRHLVSTRTAAQRGPLEDIIRWLKSDPSQAASFFSYDMYAAENVADPEYFHDFDQALRKRIDRQSGSNSAWHFVEFTLEYALPQSGPPVYTAESALIPLAVASPLCGSLRGLAEREFQSLRNPLLDKMY